MSGFLARSILLGVLFTLSSPLAHAQLEHGTIVVFIVSKDRVVIAADSRSVSSQSGRLPTDDACKITALGTRLLFAEAGISDEGHTLLANRNWSVQQEALAAFAKFQKSRKHLDAVEQVSRDWLTAMKWIYRRSLKQYGQDILRHPSNVLTQSRFLGINEAGKIEGRWIDIVFDRTQLEAGKVVVKIRDKPWEMPVQPLVVTMGNAEVVLSFLRKSGDYGHSALEHWLAGNPAPPGDINLAAAKFLVEYAEDNSPPADGIGGPIDEVEMLPGQGVQWVNRKPGCPADSSAK